MEFYEKLKEIFDEHDKEVRKKALEEVLSAVRNHYKIYRCVPSIFLLEEIIEKLENK